MTVEYADGKIDRASVVGGRFDPELAMPVRPLPKFVSHAISGRWLGQDGGGAVTRSLATCMSRSPGSPPSGRSWPRR